MANSTEIGPDAVEVATLASCQSKLIQLQNQAPDWFAFYEDSMPDTADRATLVELLRTAPNDFAKGVLYGKFVMRMDMAAITGRGFQ